MGGDGWKQHNPTKTGAGMEGNWNSHWVLLQRSCRVPPPAPCKLALLDFSSCKAYWFWEIPLPKPRDSSPSLPRVVIQSTQEHQNNRYGTFPPCATLGKQGFEPQNLVLLFKGVEGGIRGVLDTSFASVSQHLGLKHI